MFTAPGYSRAEHEAPILVKLSSSINKKVPTRTVTLDLRGDRRGDPRHPVSGLQSQPQGFHGGEPRASRGSIPKPVCPSPAADASFVAAFPSTQVVYFFFEETASEFEFFYKLHTSRVARVCKVGLPGGRRGWPRSQWGRGKACQGAGTRLQV